MLVINDDISISDDELRFSFIRAGGPGGQNVNKVSSAVQLRFDVRHTEALPEPVRVRLVRLAGSRVTKDGVIVLTANRHRTQEANRRDAVARLRAMVLQALVQPKKRVATKPSWAAKQRRLEKKTRRSALKRLRDKKIRHDD